MAASPYFAQYCTFKTTDKSSGAFLLSADSLIGDDMEIRFEVVDGRQVACLWNRFGHPVGQLDRSITHQLLLCQADGWELHAILSAVLFSEEGNSSYYWGEAAIMCFSKRYAKEFNAFKDGICKLLRSGKRPLITLKKQGIDSVISSGSAWIPKDREPKRKLEEGTIVVKDYLKYDERLVEMARNKNIGCMIIGWLFIFALIALAGYVIWNLVLRFA